MSIGEVLANLRADFPDATISKLRFLEAEGLVQPRRTPSGYRKYSASDLARLRYVLTAQRDHYLPLRVIREQLEAMDEGADVPLTTSVRPRTALVALGTDTASAPAAPADLWLNRAEVVERSGASEQLLTALEQHGLVAAGPSGHYDADALTIVTVARKLGEYGIEPRHLRAYRTAADREVGLFAQLVAPLVRQSSPAARARAADTLRELSALSQQLQAVLVRVGLRQTLGQ